MIKLKRSVKRLWLRIRMSMVSRWQRIWLGVSFSMITQRILIPTAIEQWNIAGSGFIPDKDFKIMRASQNRWHEAENLQRYGDYHRAVSIREDILTELYNYQGIADSKYFPPLLGTSWSSNFGHLAAIGHLRLAELLGIVPAGKRILLDNNNSANPQLLVEVSREMLTLKQNSGTRWSEMPAFWHISERLRMIRCANGFMDGSKLWDNIFKESNLEHLKNNFLKLSEQYSMKSRRELESYGLPKSAKFVALHIREGNSTNDPRTQPISSFIQAMQEITKNGYWIIRIGDPSMTFLPNIPMVIDLVPKQDSARDVHAYVLACCHFVLGTPSGPPWVSRLFGVPSLITNLTEVGTGAISGPNSSIFIPKKYVNRNGELLSLSKMFSEGLAYAGLTLSELKSKGLSLVPNSSEEIFEATKEILNNINGNEGKSNLFSESVNSIRSNYGSPTWGNFAESFLSRNPAWFRQI